MPTTLHAPNLERVATPDGVSVSVGEWGNSAGPEILFIHGAAQSMLSFERQYDSELARDFRLVAYDLRGHGFSDKPLDPRHYREGRRWADEAQAVIDAKRLKRPVMVGWSLGGRVLREYLMAYGDRGLSGINILAARPFEVDAVVGPASKAMMTNASRDLAGRIAAAIAFLRACFDKQPDPQDFITAVAYNFMIPFEVRDAIAGWKTDPADVRAAFAAVTVPTLITHGRRDSLILPLAAEMCAEAIKGARISWYDDCGHSPFYEDASRYNRELAAFVAQAWRSRRG
ncbi:MAG: alpha/beta hydrolase [Alphaproteobacteria bacterium]|nr:alpha/beta hydrolase [Alphaproteobacteria bacterium]